MLLYNPKSPANQANVHSDSHAQPHSSIISLQHKILLQFTKQTTPSILFLIFFRGLEMAYPNQVEATPSPASDIKSSTIIRSTPIKKKPTFRRKSITSSYKKFEGSLTRHSHSPKLYARSTTVVVHSEAREVAVHVRRRDDKQFDAIPPPTSKATTTSNRGDNGSGGDGGDEGDGHGGGSGNGRKDNDEDGNKGFAPPASDTPPLDADAIDKQRKAIKNKILAIGLLSKVFRLLKERASSLGSREKHLQAMKEKQILMRDLVQTMTPSRSLKMRARMNMKVLQKTLG